MQNLEPKSTNEIRVSGNTHPTTLSGYIHTSLNSYSKTCIVAVGPKAISTAMKAIAVARLNISQTDTDIVALPEFAEIIMDDIKLNGNPLNEAGKEVVGEALEMAVGEVNKSEGNGQERVHVGMKIFIAQVKRIVDCVDSNQDNQNRGNSSNTQNTTSKNTGNKNKEKQGKNRRKPLSEEELFLAHVGGKRAKSVNSHGIPRV